MICQEDGDKVAHSASSPQISRIKRSILFVCHKKLIHFSKRWKNTTSKCELGAEKSRTVNYSVAEKSRDLYTILPPSLGAILPGRKIA